MTDLADRSVSAPRRRSPARLQRRRLAVDLALALVFASVFLIVAGGLGVVAWFGVPILLVGLLTLAVERIVRRRRGRRRSRDPISRDS